VFIVTGGSAGVGYELSKLLYSKNATVYLATRDAAKAEKRINEVKALFPESEGKLEFHLLDLGDLAAVKQSADAFLAKEIRLDVLWLNAGVMAPPPGMTTAQVYLATQIRS
jgi:retinol dehydrogenase-12